MLTRLLMTLKSAAPASLRHAVMRRWYDSVARQFPQPEWRFMNFGYAEPTGEAGVPLSAQDEPDRCCIQLYNHVAGAADLAGKDVLEVGSGRGGGTAWLLRHFGARSVTGLDWSAGAVELCERTHRLPGLSFRQGSAEALPFADGSFDIVVNVESSHEYDRMEVFLAEVWRVLRPGGVLLWADFRRRDKLPELERCFAGSGLVPVRRCDITANVLLALDTMREQRLALIRDHIPWYTRGLLREFAAVRGSDTCDSLADGRRVYLSAALRKQS